MVNKKLRIGLVFGGRSAEHEVSLVSAAAIMGNLDRAKYEVVPICITRRGCWLLGIEPARLIAAEQDITQWEKREEQGETTAVTLVTDPTLRHLISLENAEPLFDGALDIIFPALLGTYGEDGTIQGLFEMASIPYVGCGVLGASLGMDKEKMKMIAQTAGLPIVPYQAYRRTQWEHTPERIIAAIEQDLGYPCFVKPANLGSSIGISKAHNRHTLEQALQLAVKYDRKIIIERAIKCSELECAVLGNDEPIASVVGGFSVNNEFYDYETKYLQNNKIQKAIPAQLPQSITEEVRRLALQAFAALDLSGLARIDFFLEQETNTVFFNEVNTFPAFSEFGMYSLLWQASGLRYADMLDRLIELALERYAERQRCSVNL